MKNRFPRSFYINKGYALTHSDPETGLEIHCGEMAGKFYAIAFSGKRQKPDWHYSFRTAERRDEKIAEYLASLKANSEYKTQRKAERVSAPRDLEVGDILRASWGYDQTNIDFYEVTGLIGEHMVEIRPIAQHIAETGWLCGKCAPKPGVYTGEPMRRVARNGSVRMTSYCKAYKMKPAAEVAGVKVYDSSYWSAYA